MSRRGRLLRVALLFAVMVVLGVLVMPGRLWFGQRDAIAQAEAQLDSLRDENAALHRKVDQLGSPSNIERQAREGFGWVHVRDELYTVPPAPPMVVDLPDVWPFSTLEEPLADIAATG